jgi:hypothetical protein
VGWSITLVLSPTSPPTFLAMSGLLGILGPVFVLIGLGVVAGARLDVKPEPLAKLAYWIIGPAFMFDALASADIAGAPDRSRRHAHARRALGE